MTHKYSPTLEESFKAQLEEERLAKKRKKAAKRRYQRVSFAEIAIVVAVVSILAYTAHLTFKAPDPSAKTVRLSNAQSAMHACSGHGGVNAVGGGSRRGYGNVAACKDGTAHDLPVYVTQAEYEQIQDERR